MRGLVVDNFAGGGGASAGIEAALGRPIDFAINHDAEAIAMHRANHPATHHLQTSVWDVNPRRLVRGRPVDLGWFSPDCTFHSKARGGKPFRERDTARRRRGLAWLIPYWMKTVRPSVVMLENVPEFADWGPLLKDGRVCNRRRGSTFRRWVAQIENLGYAVDMRELKACEYGAPTTRKRLFVIARCDGLPIVFPEATHGAGLAPYRTAAECIDFTLPCPSIFTRAKPLAPATMRRIWRGIHRYVIDSPTPFIVGIDNRSNGARDAWPGWEPLRTVTSENRFALVAPFIANTRNGERVGQAPRVRDVMDPLPTVTAHGSQGALVAAFLAQHNTGMTGHDVRKPLSTTVSKIGPQALVTSHLLHLRNNCDGRDLEEPLRTVSAQGQHHAEVRAFLLSYYGTDQKSDLFSPAPTQTTHHRLGLVMVHGEPYRIVDIGMRMLTPRELFRAQSFAPDYVIDRGLDDAGDVVPLTKTAQVRMCGNSVPPVVAEALVRANVTAFQEQAAA
jgi:DNA (cytosine-5)-methyltransferase 1